jgi:hypothetical protein
MIISRWYACNVDILSWRYVCICRYDCVIYLEDLIVRSRRKDMTVWLDLEYMMVWPYLEDMHAMLILYLEDTSMCAWSKSFMFITFFSCGILCKHLMSNKVFSFFVGGHFSDVVLTSWSFLRGRHGVKMELCKSQTHSMQHNCDLLFHIFSRIEPHLPLYWTSSLAWHARGIHDNMSSIEPHTRCLSEGHKSPSS